MSSDDSPDLITETAPPDLRRGRGRGPVVLLSLASAVCLLVAVAAGTSAHADLVPAHRCPARRSGRAGSSRPVAKLACLPAPFHSTLGYSTSLLTTETASRVGIATQDSCTSSIDPALARLAARSHCQAAVRATYLDQLQGVLYTIGVLAFPTRETPERSRPVLSGPRGTHLATRAGAAGYGQFPVQPPGATGRDRRPRRSVRRSHGRRLCRWPACRSRPAGPAVGLRTGRSAGRRGDRAADASCDCQLRQP